ncbi:hypothetical protein DL93DRAFT_2093945 [Clavulina sp. PMI_390]|nr:hypothetical protein DL93DRAFT_2093945 [Clavulina sp. PMI_390]
MRLAVLIISSSIVIFSLLSWHLLSSSKRLGSLSHKHEDDPLRPSNETCNLSSPSGDRFNTPPEVEAKGRLLANLTVHGRPTQAFRDNLWADKKYVSSWGSAGFTNDFETYMILIYLGMISDRIPILPAISRTHHVLDSPDIWLGDVFDLATLSDAINHPILEWRDVKGTGSSEDEVMKDEVLSCWSPWWLTGPDGHARECNAPVDLRLDISYTLAPHWTRLNEGTGVSVWSLAALGFQEGFDKGVEEHSPTPSIFSGTIAEPDMHLLCFDYIYNSGFLWNKDSFDSGHSPVWRAVARHARFSDEVQNVASRYVKHALGIPPDGAIPPFIAVHNRRTDFAEWCHGPEALDISKCLPSLDAFAVRVQETQVELRRRAKRPGSNEGEAALDPGSEFNHVLITSDEPMWLTNENGKRQRNPYWEQIDTLGWRGIDHDAQGTVEVYGKYFPMVIDQAIHAMAVGFVGTDSSTISDMAARRVETWNHGISSSVKWGYEGADAH